MRAALIVMLLFACAGAAHAHGLRTAFVEIDEVEPGRAMLHLRLSVPDEGFRVSVDDDCTLILDEERVSARDRPALIACADGEIAGHTIMLHGLGPVLSDAVVWARYADGSTQSQVLSREASTWTLPAHATAASVVAEYVRLGVAHILTGWDHLLFLLLLVLTLRSAKQVLWAETAFTLSHSISFTATSLGWLRVAAPPAEACIALSLVLLALDVGRPTPRRSSWTGPAMAFVFGLVHGLGFAGGLREIGLPEHDVAAALVSFGVGVELGQVGFLALVLVLVHFAVRARAWSRVTVLAAYASGGVATFWLIERLTKCFAI